jgi:hypothetical protein
LPTITPAFHCGVVGAFQQEFLQKAFIYKSHKMTKSCIKIKPITGNSEKHNFREIEPKYLIEKSNQNISIEKVPGKKLDEYRKDIENRYLEKVGQKMQSKMTPLREGVVLLKNDDNRTNALNLKALSEKLEENYNIKTLQIHIHNDEGHVKPDGTKSYNYHAHMVFDWTDHETGKSLKIDKQQLSEIQSLTSEVLDMERGVKGSKSLSLNHHEYRGFLEIKDKLEKDLKLELKQEQEQKIRQEIVAERKVKEQNKTLENERRTEPKQEQTPKFKL